jgi:hypothetical protein
MESWQIACLAGLLTVSAILYALTRVFHDAMAAARLKLGKNRP